MLIRVTTTMKLTMKHSMKVIAMMTMSMTTTTMAMMLNVGDDVGDVESDGDVKC